MSDISFFHIASVYTRSTEQVVGNIRKYHSNNFYYLCVDGVGDYEYLAETYRTSYRNYSISIGGPKADYGFRLYGTLEFLNRFRDACLKCNTNHMMMVEDDVWLIKPVTVEKEWEMACHNIKIGNIIPDFIHDMIESYSGVKPTFKQYGAGGGSIFNVQTFLDNYDGIIQWFKINFEQIQSVYPTIGYIDCFMVVFYLLCGKSYTVNPHLTDTHNHKPGFDYETFISNQPEQIQIINNYKKYYYE